MASSESSEFCESEFESFECDSEFEFFESEYPMSESYPFLRVFPLDNIVSPAEPVVMNPEVWSRLPFDVLGKVLLRVPLASQARFRAVSMAAHCFLSSEQFRVQSAEIASSLGRLPVVAIVDSYVSPFELQVPYQVHKLNLSFIPPQFWRSHELYSGKGVLFIVVDLVNRKGRCVGKSICLVNPINKSWRQLPDLEVKDTLFEIPEADPLHTVSLMGEEDCAFQVFVLHDYMLRRGQLGDTPCSMVSVYSSRTDAWTSEFIVYEDPVNQAGLLLALFDLVVGKKYVYGLKYHWLNSSTIAGAELFKASNGKHVRSLALPPLRIEKYELALIKLGQGECLVAVPCFEGTCKILALPTPTSRGWDEVSALPKALAMKMAPGVDFSLEDELLDTGDVYYAGPKQFPSDAVEASVKDVQVAGRFVVLSQAVNQKWHVVVYDFLSGTWKIVLSHFWGGQEMGDALLPWEHVIKSACGRGIIYLEPRPTFRVGMEDCPPEFRD